MLADEQLVLPGLRLMHAEEPLVVAEHALAAAPRLLALPLPRLHLRLQGHHLALQHGILGHEGGALGGEGGVLHLGEGTPEEEGGLDGGGGEATVPLGGTGPPSADLLLGRLRVQVRVLLLQGGGVPLQRQHLVVERSVLVLQLFQLILQQAALCLQ